MQCRGTDRVNQIGFAPLLPFPISRFYIGLCHAACSPISVPAHLEMRHDKAQNGQHSKQQQLPTPLLYVQVICSQHQKITAFTPCMLHNVGTAAAAVPMLFKV